MNLILLFFFSFFLGFIVSWFYKEWHETAYRGHCPECGYYHFDVIATIQLERKQERVYRCRRCNYEESLVS